MASPFLTIEKASSTLSSGMCRVIRSLTGTWPVEMYSSARLLCSGADPSVYAQTATDSFVGVTLALLASAGVTMLVASFLLRTDKSEEEGDLSAATASMEAMKGRKSVSSSVLGAGGATRAANQPIHDIVFACDAGMGSSAMGASVLRKKIKDAGFHDVTVVNKAIANLEDTYDVVITHQDLTERARQRTGSAVHVSVDNFMGSPRYDEIVELIQQTNAPVGAAVGAGAQGALSQAAPSDSAVDVLSEQSVVLNGRATTRDDAITEAGRLLVEVGAVEPSYVDAMHEREASVSTHMGNGLAIPHGTNEAKSSIRRTAISFVRYPDGIDWKGKKAEFVVGIASAGNDHLKLLGRIAEIFLDADRVAQLRAAQSPAEVSRILGGVGGTGS